MQRGTVAEMTATVDDGMRGQCQYKVQWWSYEQQVCRIVG